MPSPKPDKGTNKVFQPSILVRAGDVILNPRGDGGHVVLKDHVLPAMPYRPGYSDDYVHWSVGPSTGGA